MAKRKGCHKERVKIGRKTFMRHSSACGPAKKGWNKAKSAHGKAKQSAGLAFGRKLLKSARVACGVRKGENTLTKGRSAHRKCVGKQMKIMARAAR